MRKGNNWGRETLRALTNTRAASSREEREGARRFVRRSTARSTTAARSPALSVSSLALGRGLEFRRARGARATARPPRRPRIRRRLLRLQLLRRRERVRGAAPPSRETHPPKNTLVRRWRRRVCGLKSKRGVCARRWRARSMRKRSFSFQIKEERLLLSLASSSSRRRRPLSRFQHTSSPRSRFALLSPTLCRFLKKKEKTPSKTCRQTPPKKKVRAL